MKQFWADC